MSRSAVFAVLTCTDLLLVIVTSGLSVADLVHLTQVSSVVRGPSLEVVQSIFCAQRFITAIFGGVAGLEQLLSSGELLVTGAPVLRYMSDFAVKRAELLFIVSPSRVVDLLHFLSRRGFSIEFVVGDATVRKAREPVVKTYCIRKGGAGCLMWVQVPKSSVLDVFLSQRSTLLLNGIYRGRFFSLCPRASLLDRRGVVLRRPLIIPDDCGQRAAQPGGDPYGLRTVGYKIPASRLSGLHETLLPGYRRLGDKWCWLTGNPECWLSEETFLSVGWEIVARFTRYDELALSVTAGVEHSTIQNDAGVHGQ